MTTEGAANGQSGAVFVVQRTSSDLKLHPHLHVLFLDGGYRELGADSVSFAELPRLSTREVGDVLENTVGRIVKHLRRGGLLASLDGEASDESEMDGLTALIALAASGRRSP